MARTKGADIIKQAFDRLHKSASKKRSERYLKCSRDKAIALGQKVYWTGKPCVNGHVDFRYVKHNRCTQCTNNCSKRAQVKKTVKGAEGISNTRLKIDRLLDQRRTKSEFDY